MYTRRILALTTAKFTAERPILNLFSSLFTLFDGANRPVRPVTRLLSIGLIVGLAVACIPALADDAHEAELAALRQEISALESRLAKDGESRDATAVALDELEQRVVATRKRISDTHDQQTRVRREIAQLEVQKQALERSLDAQRSHIADLLRTLYVTGEQAQIRMLLSEQSPARATRALVWYQYVAQARNELIASIDADIAKSREVNASLEQRATSLSEMEASLLKDETALSQAARDKQDLLATIDKRLSTGEQRATQLKDNEKRLVTLIETIARARREARRKSERLAREAARERARRQREAERKRALAEQQQREDARKRAEAEQRRLKAEQKRIEEQLARELAARQARKPFESLKGELQMPLTAEIIGRFGEQKPNSGVRWEGLMLATDAGKPVEAIAAGEVVYAGWYRGYGQLLLIDHGDDYISLYSHNSEILKNIGDDVSAGEIVALVGATGGLAEPGLYFEIREASRPRDPLIWCKLEK